MATICGGAQIRLAWPTKVKRWNLMEFDRALIDVLKIARCLEGAVSPIGCSFTATFGDSVRLSTQGGTF